MLAEVAMRSRDAAFTLDVSHAALVLTDPQVDFLSPRGLTWTLVGDSVQRNHTVENIERLLQAARRADMVVAIAPHHYARGELRDGGALMPEYTPYLLAGKTIMAAPHTLRGPCGGLAVPLRGYGVAHVVLAGMSANVCLTSHLRALVDGDFHVVVVTDATAAESLPTVDAYESALTRFRDLASALWSTEETLCHM
jgi:nicotinamidase-related amidase